MNKRRNKSKPKIPHFRKTSSDETINQSLRAESGSSIRDVVQQIEIGEIERPEDAIIDPWSVFERIKLDRFTGREWLIAEVDTFLRENDRGYFILQASAGLGKTTFLAHLVNERNYVRHFVEQAPGQEGVAPSLRNLAAQLAKSWELDIYFGSSASRPDFFLTILNQVAQKRNAIHSEEKIVIVVDGLDQAGSPPGQNVLGLPSVLPAGVYFILSQRPVRLPLRIEAPHRIFRLEAEKQENQSDMRAYLKAATTWPGVAHELETGGYTPEEFIETLLKKCRGVWIYLHYVIDEIERGRRSPLALESLPENLWQYYTQYWQDWRKRDESAWDNEYLPLLSTLAATQESLPLSQLCSLAGVTERPELSRLFQEEWRPFLTVEETKNLNSYRFYHASLHQFLDGQVDLEHLDEAERNFAKEMAKATRKAHKNIADHYLAIWGGLDAGLPKLAELIQPTRDEAYGLRYLALHLECADRITELHDLLQLEYTATIEIPYASSGSSHLLKRIIGRPVVLQQINYKNTWYLVNEKVGYIDSYLVDLERAWRLAQKHGDIGLQCRYALITASLNTLARNIPLPLLIALVEKKEWQPNRALGYARQLPDPEQRAMVLVKLVLHLLQPLDIGLLTLRNQKNDAKSIGSNSKLIEVLQEALSITLKIGDEKEKIEVLINIVKLLPNELQRFLTPQALAVVKSLKNEWWQLLTLAKLSSHLPEPPSEADLTELVPQFPDLLAYFDRPSDPKLMPLLLLESFVVMVFVSEDPWTWIRTGRVRFQTVMRLAQFLHNWHLPELLKRVQVMTDERRKAFVLIGLVYHLPEQQRQDVLEEVLTITRSLKPGGAQAWILAEVASYPSPPSKQDLLREALASVEIIRDENERVRALGILTVYLPEELLPDVLKIIWSFKQGETRAEALELLATCTGEMIVNNPVLLGKLLEIVKSIPIATSRFDAIAAWIPHLPPKILFSTAAEIIFGSDWRGKLACRLLSLSNLPLGLLEEMLVFAGDCKGPAAPERHALAVKLTQLGYHKVGLAIAATIGGEGRAKVLAEQAANLQNSMELVALEKCLKLPNSDWFGPIPKIEALSQFIRYLPELEGKRVLREILTDIQTIGDTDEQNWTLINLGPHLPDELLQETLHICKIIQDENKQVQSLKLLIPHLPETLLTEAVQQVQKIKDYSVRFELVGVLTTRLWTQFVRSQQTQPIYQNRLITLLKWLVGPWFQLITNLPGQVLSILIRMGVIFFLTLGLTVGNIFRFFSPKRQATLITKLFEMGDYNSALVLALLLVENERVKNLENIVPNISSHFLQEVVGAIRRIKSDNKRNLILVDLLEHLSEPLRSQVRQELFEAIQKLPEQDWFGRNLRISGMVKLIPHMPEPQRKILLQDAQSAVYAIDRGPDWTYFLAMIGQYLPKSWKEIRERLEEIPENFVLARRADAFVKLAPHVQEPMEILQDAGYIETKMYRYQLLKAATLRLAELGHIEEALAEIQKVRNESIQAEALANLGELLPQASYRVLMKLSAIGLSEDQAEVLALAPYFPELFLPELLDIVRKMPAESSRVSALKGLAPHLPDAYLKDALEIAKSIDYIDYEIQAVNGLIPYLPERLLQNVIVEVRNTKEAGRREKYLAGIAASLAKRKRNTIETLWCESLPTLAQRNRKDLLSDIRALEPIIARLGGQEAVVETFRAIQDVSRWWP